jgi:hypothetical protein
MLPPKFIFTGNVEASASMYMQALKFAKRVKEFVVPRLSVAGPFTQRYDDGSFIKVDFIHHQQIITIYTPFFEKDRDTQEKTRQGPPHFVVVTNGYLITVYDQDLNVLRSFQGVVGDDDPKYAKIDSGSNIVIMSDSATYSYNITGNEPNIHLQLSWGEANCLFARNRSRILLGYYRYYTEPYIRRLDYSAVYQYDFTTGDYMGRVDNTRASFGSFVEPYFSPLHATASRDGDDLYVLGILHGGSAYIPPIQT